MNDAKEKMALIPYGAELLHNPITKAAGFKMKNVYVMAGLPEIMVAMFKKIIRNIKGGNRKITKNIPINLPESDIAEYLSKIQNEFNQVEIRSYPLFRNKKKKVNVVLTGFNKIDIKEVERKIKKFINFIK